MFKLNVQFINLSSDKPLYCIWNSLILVIRLNNNIAFSTLIILQNTWLLSSMEYR